MPATTLRFGVKIGLAFWLLLAPGENWTWVIVGGHDVLNACEQERNERLDGDYLVCVATPPEPATAYQPGGPGPGEQPSPGLTWRDQHAPRF